MTDVFHENFNFDKQIDLINRLTNFPHLTFCLLTKRPKNAKRVFESFALLPANIWLGVTVCNQDEADEKIPILLNTPAIKCFISIEPCLSRIDLYNIHALDWVILGGENGSGARPLHLDWARNIRDHCKKLAIPFFFKGWGTYLPCGEHFEKVGKATSGRLLDGVEYSEVPE
jgi:protein gp37